MAGLIRAGAATTRRAFLAGSAAGGLVLAGRSATSLARSAAPGAWQVGCYTRPWDDHDYRVALDGIASAGYAYAGLLSHKGKSWILITVETTPAEAREYGDEVTRRGLKMLSVYGDFPLQERADATIDGLKTLIDRAASAGSPNLLLGGTEREEQVPAFLAAVAGACEHASRQGVALQIKPHGGRNATGAQCRALVERVAHPSFQIWYDPGNIQYYSDGRLDPVEDAGSVDGLVVGMSAKDFRPPKSVDVTPGEGQVNFPGVLARLRQGGFRSGPIVVETLARGEAAAVTAEARKARERIEAWLAEA